MLDTTNPQIAGAASEQSEASVTSPEVTPGFVNRTIDNTAEKTANMLDSVTDALNTATGRTALAGAAVITYGFEQSPLNEQWRANWGIDALWQTKELLENTGSRWLGTIGAAAATGGAVFLMTGVIEGISGGITAATISIKDGTLGKFNRAITGFAKKIETRDWKGKPKGDVALALAGGTSPLVVKKFAEADGRMTTKDKVKTVGAGMVGIATFSGAIGAATAVAIDTADIHGHPELALEASDFVTSPKTWWSLYGAIILTGAMSKAFDNVGSNIGARINSSPLMIPKVTHPEGVIGV